jgi:hypothetical protein
MFELLSAFRLMVSHSSLIENRRLVSTVMVFVSSIVKAIFPDAKTK